MFIIKYKKIFIWLSVALVLLAVSSIAYFGLSLGIDFKGGAVMEVNYPSGRPEVSILENEVSGLDIGPIFQPAGENGYLVKTRDLTDVERQSLFNALGLSGTVSIEEISFNSVGPSVGTELKRKAIIQIILVCFGIVLFIAYAFRKVSKPVSSWKYGIIAVCTLLHDVLIPLGIFAAIASFKNLEVDTLLIVSILTILGLSVSDTIVVFDRIRENLKDNLDKNKEEDFKETVGKSISQTFTRSINTSLTVILALAALAVFGPGSTRYFAIMLTAGMFFGTYSSIFLASPLLVAWEQRRARKLKK